MLPFTKVFKFIDFIFYKLEHSPGIKAGYALVSISGFFFLAFYMYEKTMIIFCGAGAPQENVETDEDCKRKRVKLDGDVILTWKRHFLLPMRINWKMMKERRKQVSFALSLLSVSLESMMWTRLTLKYIV